MKVVTSGRVGGEIAAPPSKSMMQRAVIAATLVSGETTIKAPSYSDDGLASLRVAESLGAKVTKDTTTVKILGGRAPTGEALHCGESGTSMRMFSAVCGLFSLPLVLEAEGSLKNRPMRMIEDPLRALGASVSTTDGHAPMTIHGPIRGGVITVDGSTSSQFLSGLLMSLPLCKEDSTVLVPELKSKPYVLMTLELLEAFGITVNWNSSLTEFKIPGRQQYRPIVYTVEGDWSGASFPLVAAAIAGELTVYNLKPTSSQADRAILEALKLAGAIVNEGKDSITVKKGPLKGFEFDASECPDLFPPLVALASQCAGKTVLQGAKRLTHKESDRGAVLKKEFGTLGISVDIDGDTLTILGGKIEGGAVFSHHDHRIAMACGVAALVSDRPVEISNPECVAKSYPDFFEMLQTIKEAR